MVLQVPLRIKIFLVSAAGVSLVFWVVPFHGGRDVFLANHLQITQNRYYSGETPVTGEVRSYHPNKEMKKRFFVKEGQLHGIYRYWDMQGTLLETRYYHQNIKRKTHRGWFTNGRQRFVYHFDSEGRYHGDLKEWADNGQIIKDFHYDHGLESGLQRFYNRDGTIRGNYRALENERYGIIGQKKCRGFQQLTP